MRESNRVSREGMASGAGPGESNLNDGKYCSGTQHPCRDNQSTSQRTTTHKYKFTTGNWILHTHASRHIGQHVRTLAHAQSPHKSSLLRAACQPCVCVDNDMLCVDNGTRVMYYSITIRSVRFYGNFSSSTGTTRSQQLRSQPQNTI